MFCWWFNGNIACKFVMQVFSLSVWGNEVCWLKIESGRETLTGIGRHWQASGDTDRHRETLTGIARHWQAWGDTDRHRETLTGMGRHWQASGDTDRHRETLTGMGRHWQASGDTDRHRETLTGIEAFRVIASHHCCCPAFFFGVVVKLSSLKSNQSGHVYSTLATPFSPTELRFKGDPSSEAPQTLSMGMEWKIHRLLSAYSFVRWKVTLESR